MPFPASIIRRAWNRQGGSCAYCCKRLRPGNRDRGETDAWHPHHRKPEDYEGTDSLRNCVILCMNEPENCHYRIGHGGMGWMYYAPLSDAKLRCLFSGVKRGRRTRRRKG